VQAARPVLVVTSSTPKLPAAPPPGSVTARVRVVAAVHRVAPAGPAPLDPAPLPGLADPVDVAAEPGGLLVPELVDVFVEGAELFELPVVPDPLEVVPPPPLQPARASPAVRTRASPAARCRAVLAVVPMARLLSVPLPL
jgi:hypothetical protein